MIPLDEDAALLERASGKEVAGQPRWMYENPHELVPQLASRLRDRSAAIRRVEELTDRWVDEATNYPATSEGEWARTAVHLCIQEARDALAGSETK